MRNGCELIGQIAMPTYQASHARDLVILFVCDGRSFLSKYRDTVPTKHIISLFKPSLLRSRDTSRSSYIKSAANTFQEDYWVCGILTTRLVFISLSRGPNTYSYSANVHSCCRLIGFCMHPTSCSKKQTWASNVMYCWSTFNLLDTHAHYLLPNWKLQVNYTNDLSFCLVSL